jgi:glycosyltransferase involved in cell wall biosynthesis
MVMATAMSRNISKRCLHRDRGGPANAMSGLRVMHFIESLEIGGAERTVLDLARNLPAHGIHVVVCCLRDGPLRGELERAGSTVLCLGMRRHGMLWLPWFVHDVWRIVRWLSELLREQRIDLMHAHMADAVMLGLVAGQRCGVPVIASFHGLGLLPRGRARIDPRNALRRRLYRFIAARAACSIAVSPQVLGVLRDELGFAAARIQVLGNGIDTEVYGGNEAARGALALRRALGLDDDARFIVTVGRLVRDKGQRDLVTAMPALRMRCPTATLLIIGDGVEREPLAALIERLGLHGAVLMLGTRTDIAEHLALAEVFALVSASEGVPLALLEAMAACRPVVATAVPGIVDVVVDGATALLVPYANPPALAEALARVMDDRELARQLAHAARAAVCARYDIRAVVRAMAALYTDVLRDTAGAHHSRGASKG